MINCVYSFGSEEAVFRLDPSLTRGTDYRYLKYE